MMLMRAIDANHDGELSAAEIKGAGAAILKALDKNGDKKISKDEMTPKRPEGGEGRRPRRRGGEGEEGARRPRRGGEGDQGGGRKRPEAEE